MAFRLRLDAEAVRALTALPPAVRRHVLQEFRRFAADPSALSRPAAFPHPLTGQLFDTRCTVAGTEHFITVMFRYHADEKHIEIEWIIHRQRPNSGLSLESE